MYAVFVTLTLLVKIWYAFVCRAINYDEKDPFLCNACGYCKYAKFDFTVTSRPCCAVDPIENDDDRKKVPFTNLHLLCTVSFTFNKEVNTHAPPQLCLINKLSK